jgi:hypothetical protein
MKRAALLILMMMTTAGVAACGGDDDDSAADATTTSAPTKAAAAECDVVGDTDGAATSDLDVTLAEWTIKYEGDRASAGNVRLVVHNEGEVDHEIAIEDGTGKLIGEIEPFASGSTCEGTFALAAGSYTLKCEVVDEDGMSHEEHGMKEDLIVK